VLVLVRLHEQHTVLGSCTMPAKRRIGHVRTNPSGNSNCVIATTRFTNKMQRRSDRSRSAWNHTYTLIGSNRYRHERIGRRSRSHLRRLCLWRVGIVMGESRRFLSRIRRTSVITHFRRLHRPESHRKQVYGSHSRFGQLPQRTHSRGSERDQLSMRLLSILHTESCERLR